MSSTLLPPHANSFVIGPEVIKHTHIRSPIGLVVGSCTNHPGVLASIPKREEPGKTGAPCVKVPGSSRVPAPPWVGSRSPDGSRLGSDFLSAWWWVLHQPPWSFGFDSQTRGNRENGRTLCKSTGFLTGPNARPPPPYTYSTHRFPDERTPIEATPLSATSAELGLGLGLGLGLDSLSHFSSHALPFFSPPSFHTLAFFPAFTSVWWSA